MGYARLHWTLSGTGIQTKGTSLNFPFPGIVLRSKLRASTANTATASIYLITNLDRTAAPADGTAANTLAGERLPWSKTGISLSQSATSLSDSTVPAATLTNAPVFQGGLYVFIDMTAATGAWTVLGAIDVEYDPTA